MDGNGFVSFSVALKKFFNRIEYLQHNTANTTKYRLKESININITVHFYLHVIVVQEIEALEEK